jgi:hypothetical protein
MLGGSGGEIEMTDAQRKLVCVALVAVGLVLAFLTLHAGTGGYLGNRPILVPL